MLSEKIADINKHAMRVFTIFLPFNELLKIVNLFPYSNHLTSEIFNPDMLSTKKSMLGLLKGRRFYENDFMVIDQMLKTKYIIYSNLRCTTYFTQLDKTLVIKQIDKAFQFL